MVIAHNISALNTYKSLGIAGGSMQKSMEKLSSGYKINKAGDDAAGLSISEKMRSQIRGLNQASTNAENGVSMIQTAEGALNEQHSILQRMRELAVQAATDTNADEDRSALQSEMAQLTNEVNRIAATTEFNGMKILDGSKTKKEAVAAVTSAVPAVYEFTANDASAAGTLKTKIGDVDGAEVTIEDTKVVTVTFAKGPQLADSAKKATFGDVEFTLKDGKGLMKKDAVTAADNSVYFHVGANSNQVINTEFNNMSAVSLGIAFDASKATVADLSADEKVLVGENPVATVNNGTGTDATQYALNISTRAGANKAIEVIDNAIKMVSEERSKYGAIQNRLEYTMNNLNTTAENMTAAESTIRDVDMAEEMMEYTKNNILQQAAQAMLVQANARPQQALQLLQ
ncbi:MAG: flagellin [Clostridia bacterium]|nr:flagellin [Clostridia bacterium]